MSFRADLHVHTFHSGDNDAHPRLMVQSAIDKGLNAIAFTEHNYYAASSYVDALREEFMGRITLLRAVEISALEGHCLVYGADPDSMQLNGRPIREVVRAVNDMGAVAVPAHPFRRGSGIGEMAGELDGIAAIEGHNGCNLRSMNTRAIDLAGSLGLPYTGGSDAHAPSEVGYCLTVFSQPANNEAELAEALRGGDYKACDTRKISRGLQII